MPADTELAALLDTFAAAHPEVIAAGEVANCCGPVAWRLCMWLREQGLPAQMMHVIGIPRVIPGAPAAVANPYLAEDGSGHYLVLLGDTVIDAAYRQFDPAAPAFVLSARAQLTHELTPHVPWVEITQVSRPSRSPSPRWADYPTPDAGLALLPSASATQRRRYPA